MFKNDKSLGLAIGFLFCVLIASVIVNYQETQTQFKVRAQWMRSVHEYNSEGCRFTLEDMERVFDLNPELVRPEFTFERFEAEPYWEQVNDDADTAFLSIPVVKGSVIWFIGFLLCLVSVLICFVHQLVFRKPKGA